MEETIKDKALKPSGLLPKNLQAFALVGLALAMVVIMAVTGHKRPSMKTVDEKVAPLSPLPVNRGQVLDFRKGIEQSQQESAPQAEAALLEEQRQLAAQGKWPGHAASPPAYANPALPVSSSAAYPAPNDAAAGPQPGEGQQADAIRDEARKRRYLSSFADNVALSFRKDGLAPSGRHIIAAGLNSAPGNPPVFSPSANGASRQEQDPGLLQIGPQLAREEQLLEQMQQVALPSSPVNAHPPASTADSQRDAAATAPETPPQEPREKTSNRDASVGTPAQAATGKTFVIFEGTVLEALLLNRLDGTFPGPVNCLLSDNIYSHDRQHVLIPAGSKILGEARKVDSLGQTRLAVVFHRLLMPDGYSVNLDQFRGADQQGATALKDKVNNHYAQIFGASLALGVLGGVAQIGTGSALTSTGTERMQEGFGVGMANAGEDVLNRFLSILPTVTIREGTRVKIYLSGDLLLPDYAGHTVPSEI
jgi:type IV secretion system protein TrbI